ncbi:uncharacterized protein scaf11 isoform 1-T2 [Syngnathus typhle]
MTGTEGGQGSPPDGSDGEEAERCPICLGVPAGGEVAMPDSCCHVFCLGCLLTWAELQMVPSCPVDRRPFRNVYRWDGNVRCVQVPVRRQVVEPEAESCVCRKRGHKLCLKSKLRKRSRQQRAEKTKGRKCNYDDTSSVSLKKVRGAEHYAWASSHFFSLATSTQDITEPLLVTQDVLRETQQCKRQVQVCPWFSPAAPITANGTSRFLPADSNRSPFTFELCSFPITSTSSFGPVHLVCQGVVCAITSPKGGEKQVGRASNSNAPAQKAESIASRPAGRNSKAQTESSACDPSSPPQSSASDSDSSASQGSEPGMTSQVPAKRKSKRVTNRKASGKRKSTGQKQSASEDGDKEEENEEAKPEVNDSDQPSDAEQSPNADQTDVDSLDGQQAAESLSSNVEDDDEKPQPDDTSRLSCSLDSPPKSPESDCSGKPSTRAEEPPVVSISTAGDEKLTTWLPSELENTLENLTSPDADVIEQDCKMETDEEGLEKSNEDDGVAQREAHESPASKPAEPPGEKLADQGAQADSQTPEIEAALIVEAGSDGPSMDCGSPKGEAVSGSAKEHPPAETSEESSKDQEEGDSNHERKNGRQRRSRFHSSTSSWSPKQDARRETSRRERAASPPSGHSSRARSRERERQRDKERDYRRERSRERKRRRSRSRSRSKSRSPSRTSSHRRGYSPERPPSRDQSPRGRERRGGWRAGNGGEGRRYHGGAARFENGVPSETSPERQGWSETPDWVMEKTREVESRNWDLGGGGGSRWEDRAARGRGGGRGGGNRGIHNPQQDDDNRRPPRNSSGMGNNSGNDAYSRFNENRPGGRRKQESDAGDSMLDRSGWSSASSWAVRRTLPADVQDYYSKRERGGAGGWTRSEEEQPATDSAKSEAAAPTAPGNTALTPMPPPPPPPPHLHHHFPVQGPRGPLPVSLQPSAPYAMTPPMPVHLHPAVPLLQAPAVGAQGLPPPPPPPPPMQHGSQTAAAQPDGQTSQMASTMGAFRKAGPLAAPTKVGHQAASQAQPSSTTQPAQHHKAQADSSKKEKKQQIQEKAIDEVKTAMKPYYQKKEITKEEYKEIVRKAVEKVCHSKSGEVNSSKVANLVKAYVDKYKHARKK